MYSISGNDVENDIATLCFVFQFLFTRVTSAF